MKRLLSWPVIATFAAFALPWTHRLMFENVRLALPDLGHDGAHGMAAGISLIIIMAVTMTQS